MVVLPPHPSFLEEKSIIYSVPYSFLKGILLRYIFHIVDFSYSQSFLTTWFFSSFKGFSRSQV